MDSPNGKNEGTYIMSTRSMIGVVDNAGQVHAVYCHFDGYPEGVGRTLVDHWNSKTRAMKLIIGGGNMRTLGATLDECEFFPNDLFEIFDSVDQFLSVMSDSDCEYLYVFADDQWTVLSNVHEVAPLKEVV